MSVGLPITIKWCWNLKIGVRSSRPITMLRGQVPDQSAPAAQTSAPAAPAQADYIEKLKKLAELKEVGIITDDAPGLGSPGDGRADRRGSNGRGGTGADGYSGP